MSEMVERVARAIAISDRFDPDELARNDPFLVMKSYTQYARAAIEAMRKPTPDMLDSCDIHAVADKFLVTELGAATVWEAMIDAALGKIEA